MRSDEPSETNPTPQLPDELVNFESQLTAFRPKSVAVNRDQLMFDAGQAAARAEILASSVSQRRSLRLWQSVAAALTFVSSGLGMAMLTRPGPEARNIFVKSQQSNTAFNSVAGDSGALAPTDSTPASGQDSITAIPLPPERDKTDHEPEFEMPRELDIVHSRNLALAQVLDSGEGIGGPKPDVSRDVRLERPFSRQPLLSPGALMNQGTRNWINRLIEEPTL